VALFIEKVREIYSDAKGDPARENEILG